eukprot:Blabericola_migrator_1__9605@NODE_523_length_7872_cov_140_842409_g400_i0_p5_GENE_NODE_523_length_7872_cov_140_842409_g400_i0NODE_523_length_7872_cov_140_842409_g400_i0_p5_ORF_typecomplete_len180_score46_49HsbA/PF12296_8/0_049Syntaxin_2/PF14523_6/0_073DELLA/PF12041_8/0_21DUF3826/PF12875_7/0_17DOCK_N/PF16172_5/0_62_NODE_523_length_7872_cov_140_842409_g400_i057836322
MMVEDIILEAQHLAKDDDRFYEEGVKYLVSAGYLAPTNHTTISTQIQTLNAAINSLLDPSLSPSSVLRKAEALKKLKDMTTSRPTQDAEMIEIAQRLKQLWTIMHKLTSKQKTINMDDLLNETEYLFQRYQDLTMSSRAELKLVHEHFISKLIEALELQQKDIQELYLGAGADSDAASN